MDVIVLSRLVWWDGNSAGLMEFSTSFVLKLIFSCLNYEKFVLQTLNVHFRVKLYSCNININRQNLAAGIAA